MRGLPRPRHSICRSIATFWFLESKDRGVLAIPVIILGQCLIEGIAKCPPSVGKSDSAVDGASED